MSIQLKRCYRCKKDYSTDNFYKSNKRKDGLQTRCKTCNYELQKEWLTQNKDKERERQRIYYKDNKEYVTGLNEKYRLKRKYGLTTEDVAQMKEIQNNLCAICGEERKLVIDHCHSTGSVRELLCISCNRMLGFARDSTFVLQKAVEYLDKHNDGKV